jgi:hypothetical protein
LIVVSFRTHLSLAGFGLAGVYAVVALVEFALVGDSRAGLVFGASAAVTGGLIAVLLPLLAPRRGDSDDDDDDGGFGGGGDGPSPPPWWPEFEREFWSHVQRTGRRGRTGPRERATS